MRECVDGADFVRSAQHAIADTLPVGSRSARKPILRLAEVDLVPGTLQQALWVESSRAPE